jgi:hypothetical protein
VTVRLVCRSCEAVEFVSASWARDFTACPACIEVGCTEDECFRADGGGALFTPEEAKEIERMRREIA